MSYVRARPKYTGPDWGTRLKVVTRDGFRCVVCGVAIVRAQYSLHHRIPRGAGGSRRPEINSAANLITLCGSATTGCHMRIELNRAEAITNGWLLPQWSGGKPTDPTQHAVLVERQSRWCYLGADGRMWDDPPVEAA